MSSTVGMCGAMRLVTSNHHQANVLILAVIFLGEAFTWKTVVGCLLLLARTLIMVL